MNTPRRACKAHGLHPNKTFHFLFTPLSIYLTRKMAAHSFLFPLKQLKPFFPNPRLTFPSSFHCFFFPTFLPNYEPSKTTCFFLLSISQFLPTSPPFFCMAFIAKMLSSFNVTTIKWGGLSTDNSRGSWLGAGERSKVQLDC